jgi:hypothetical protein
MMLATTRRAALLQATRGLSTASEASGKHVSPPFALFFVFFFQKMHMYHQCARRCAFGLGIPLQSQSTSSTVYPWSGSLDPERHGYRHLHSSDQGVLRRDRPLRAPRAEGGGQRLGAPQGVGPGQFYAVQHRRLWDRGWGHVPAAAQGTCRARPRRRAECAHRGPLRRSGRQRLAVRLQAGVPTQKAAPPALHATLSTS